VKSAEVCTNVRERGERAEPLPADTEMVQSSKPGSEVVTEWRKTRHRRHDCEVGSSFVPSHPAESPNYEGNAAAMGHRRSSTNRVNSERLLSQVSNREVQQLI
jgi:hypothetical protein